MNIQLGNIWYFLFLFASFGIFTGLYFLLRKKSEKTIKIVLSSLMIFALVLHFLKGLYPPYSLNYEIHLRDSWFINICGANIALFPFILLSKNKHLKDYMFYIGYMLCRHCQWLLSVHCCQTLSDCNIRLHCAVF